MRLDGFRDLFGIPRMSDLRGLKFLPRPVIYVGLEEDEAGEGVPPLPPASAAPGAGTATTGASKQVTLPHGTKLPEL
jgi:hypothetical protein